MEYNFPVVTQLKRSTRGMNTQEVMRVATKKMKQDGGMYVVLVYQTSQLPFRNKSDNSGDSESQ